MRSEINLKSTHGSPIDIQNNTRTPGTRPRTQIQTSTGHVVFVSHALQGNSFGYNFLGSPPGPQSLGHTRGNKAGRQRVDGNAAGSQIRSQFFGELVNGRLADIVGVGGCRLGDHPDDASDIDDAGGILGCCAFFEHGQTGARQIKNALDVQIQNLVKAPVGSSGFSIDGLPPRGTRVVDQNIQFVVKYFGGVLRQSLTAGTIRNIRHHKLWRRLNRFCSLAAGIFGS
mmetsp:Transcript_522/g.1082  ORF Transcript_522/g.1082 Transcript_522/m.1082 type:complete len:228 (-) Transcript_522:217-900(-)